MKPPRLQRVLRLVHLLQSGKGYNTAALARACGVSRRTIFRDLELLRQAGFQVVYDEAEGCYRLPSARLLPPTNFSLEEALALLALCYELGTRHGLPLMHAAQTAALKLESSLPERLRREVAGVARALHIRMDAHNPLEKGGDVFRQLLSAYGQHRAVRIAYDSVAEGEVISTRLHPYAIFFSRRSWYCVGRSSLHRAVRTFNLGRIRKLELLEDRYRVPSGFNLRRYFRNAWHMIPEPGPDHRVHLRFRPLVARNVAEVRWHRTQRCHFNEDGSLDFWVQVSGLWEISWWVMGYGDQVEVLHPPQLRQMVLQRAENIVRQYRPQGVPSPKAPAPAMKPHLAQEVRKRRSPRDK